MTSFIQFCSGVVQRFIQSVWQPIEAWCFPYPYSPKTDLDWSELEDLQRLDEVCPICAVPSIQGRVCDRCVSEPPNFDRTLAAYPFKEGVRDWIIEFKFYEQLYLAKGLAEIWWHRHQARLQDSKIERLLPVPLHLNRLLERGFNQSYELAKQLSRLTGVELESRALIRQIDTPHQVGLGREARRKNLQYAFRVEADYLQGVESIALIDDVLTTGSTVEALADLVRQQTAVKRIEVWVIARAIYSEGDE